MNIHLKIADYNIRLSEASDHAPISWPQWYFEPFHIEDSSNTDFDIDIDIKIITKLPTFSHSDLIFSGNDDLWRLFKTEAGYYLEVFHTRTHRPYSRTLLNNDFSRGTMWVRAEYSKKFSGSRWIPAKAINPAVDICLLTRLARAGGVMIHASGVQTPDGVLVFSGPSGAGKSTLADFFRERGMKALCDERLLIRKQDERIIVHGTPWPGSSLVVSNLSGELNTMCLIRHGTERHQISEAVPNEIYSTFFQQCFLPHWDQEAMERTLLFLEELRRERPLLSFAPLKEVSAVDFIMNHINKQTVRHCEELNPTETTKQSLILDCHAPYGRSQ